MKKLISVSLLIALLVLNLSLGSVVVNAQNYPPTDIKVYIKDAQLDFDQPPILIGGRVLVPVRTIAEKLGATVEWTNSVPQVVIKHNGTAIGMNINSKQGFKDRNYTFQMDQPPILVNGRTLVPVRFIELLGAKVNWDGKLKSVTMLPGEMNPLDALYKLNEVTIGNIICPADQAEQYVLQQGLLKSVTNTQYTPLRFTEFGPTDTMVTGLDEMGNEKAVWVYKDASSDEIIFAAFVKLADGMPQSAIENKLTEAGIDKTNILRIYPAPYEANKIYWYVIAQQGGKEYNYCYDFISGELVISNSRSL